LRSVFTVIGDNAASHRTVGAEPDRGAVSMKLTQLAAGGSAQWQRLMRFGGVGEEADS
jgi:hypothetical protein